MSQVACNRCGNSNSSEAKECHNCHVRFWDEWRAEWYANPMTRVSLGQHPTARSIGNLYAALLSLFGAYALCVYAIAPPLNQSLLGVLAIVVALYFFTYEVWAFTHGRATAIDNISHDAKPGMTAWRTVGLALDIVCSLGAALLLLRLK